MIVIAALLITILPLAAHAHRLNLFASTDGAMIRGSVYFQGMIAARDAAVTARDPGGALLAEVVADDAGRFAFEAARRVDHNLIVDLKDGHRATFLISAAQLPPSLPTAPEEEPSQERSSDPNTGATAGVHAQALPQAETPAAIEAIVEATVARHVGPLRQQIAAYEDKIRWHDVLGGIGYIVGMSGLAFYFIARRQINARENRQGMTPTEQEIASRQTRDN